MGMFILSLGHFKTEGNIKKNDRMFFIHYGTFNPFVPRVTPGFLRVYTGFVQGFHGHS